MPLSRDQILAAQDIERELVSVPEWGGEVWVYGLTGAELDQFQLEITRMKGQKAEVDLANVRSKLAALAMRDDGGKRLFSDADVDVLSQKSARPLARVFDAAQRLSGLTADEVERIRKN